MLEKIIVELAAILECDPSAISIETEFKELSSWDSLAHISVITMIETEFDILVRDKDFDLISTVGDLARYVEGRE